MPLRNEARKPSFEAFAEIAGSMVMAAGLTNPFGSRENPMGGDEAGRALQRLICELAPDHAELTTDKILEELAVAGTTDVVLPNAKNELGLRQSLGWKLRKLRGRAFTSKDGRRFQFGQRDEAAGSKYTLTLL